MSTTKLTIAKGIIMNYEDRYDVSCEEHKYVGNGWEVSVTEKRIYAECEREYSDGIYVISVKIQCGLMVTEWKKDGNIYDRKSKNVNYSGNGLMGLSGGNVKSRYVYWRDQEFQNLLNEHDITAVSRLRLDKDGFFCINARNAWYGGGECETSIWSDSTEYITGEVDYGRTREWQRTYRTSVFEVDTPLKIQSPNVVIVERVQHEGNNHNFSCILYTNIKGIEKMRAAINASKKISF